MPAVLWVMPRGGVTNHIGVQRRSSSFIGHADTHTLTHSALPSRATAAPVPLFLCASDSLSKIIVAPFVWPSFPSQCYPGCQTRLFPRVARLTFPSRRTTGGGRRGGRCVKIHRGFITPLRQRWEAGGCCQKAEAWTRTAASAVTPFCAFWDSEGGM